MVGIDIVKNARFKSFLDDERKISRILSSEEIKIYSKIKLEKRKLEYLGSRFAVKEALFKATNVSFNFNDVSVLNSETGKPYIVCNFINDLSIEVSISHEEEYSVAVVLIKEK